MATTTTSPLSSNAMVRDRVVSWLHDEATMVTAQQIQQECFFEGSDGGDESYPSRREASALLRGLYQADPQSYAATVCVQSAGDLRHDAVSPYDVAPRGGPSSPTSVAATACGEGVVKTTVFSCRPLARGEALDDERSTVLALAPAPSDAATTSCAFGSFHERDMGVLRDRLFAQRDELKDPAWFYRHDQLCAIRSHPRLGATASKPATPAQKTWHKYERVGGDLEVPTKASTAKASTNRKTAKAQPPKGVIKTKPTTAQSFFTKKPSAATTNSEKASSVAKKPSKAAAKAKPAAAASAKAPSDSEEASPPPSSSPRKRVRPQPNKAPPKDNARLVGTADDFVGDEDEDSDDEEDMVQRREKSKEIVRKQKEQDDLLDKLAEEHDKDWEAENPTLVRGAMDAFAVKTKPSSSSQETAGPAASSGKKRRKVLKEKTTVNAQGFLVTTTEAVWEELSDDDDDQEPASSKPKASSTKPSSSSAAARALAASKKSASNSKPKASKPKKAASDMKQGSLMGFFAVKKKK